MNIVVIPCYNRPEFLTLTLEYIQCAEGAEQYLYLFALDYGYDGRLIRIINDFPFESAKILMHRTRYTITKQSYNVMNGLLSAAKNTGNLVFMIEDDVFIGKDFFKFHEAVHKLEPDIYCSIATRNNNTKHETTDDINAYYISQHPDYQSLGVCYKQEILNTYLLPHFQRGYFENPVKYCRDVFPDSLSWIGDTFVEQDGLIRRIVYRSGKKIAFPHVARAYHAGFYGKNRGKRTKIGLDRLREITASKRLMKKYAIRPEYYTDSEPVDLMINATSAEIYKRDT